jgi:hypothetical protein
MCFSSLKWKPGASMWQDVQLTSTLSQNAFFSGFWRWIGFLHHTGGQGYCLTFRFSGGDTPAAGTGC